MKNVIDFVLGNQAVLAGILVAILDLVFALIPSVKANGILQGIYNFVKAVVNKVKAPAA